MATANSAYEEARMIMDIELLKNIKVVGMTTSGAARLRKLLQALAPPVGKDDILLYITSFYLHNFPC